MNSASLTVQKPLTLRLLKRVLGFSVALILLLAGARAWWEYCSALDAVHEEFAIIGQTTAKSVAGALWEFNREQLALHVEGIRNFRHISYAAVSDKGSLVAESGVRRTKDVLDREFPLATVYKGQRQDLGLLHVQADLQAAMHEAFSAALRAMAFNTALVLLVAGLVVWLTSNMISRHLSTLATHLQSFSLGGGSQPLALDKKPAGDELDVLAQAVNTMQDGLAASYAQVLAAQAETCSQARFPLENPSPVLRIGDGGLLLMANPASVELLGLAAGQELPEEYAAIVSRALVSGEVQHFENAFGGRFFAFAARPVAAEGFVNIYGLDITERKAAEVALRESEATFRTMVETIPLAIYLSVGKEQISEYMNPAFVNMFGYTLEDMPTSEHWWPLAYPDAKYRRQVSEEWGRRVARAIETKTSIEPMDVVCTCKDGSKKNISWGFITLGSQNYSFGLDLTERKRAEEALHRQVLALTQPLDNPAAIRFADLFNLEDIQRIQDTFAKAMNVASVITDPEGVPLTKPSNFCRLCRDVIRKTEKGLANCWASDAALGKPSQSGPTIQPCLSGGLWDAGASITLGGQHIANWLIGQVRNEAQNMDSMLRYGEEIGADMEAFKSALAEVPVMSSEQFEKVSRALFVLSSELSLRAYQNVQQARFIHARQKAEAEVRRNVDRLQCLVRVLQHRAESVQEFLDYCLSEALTLTESRFGYIYHYNDVSREFVLNSWSSEVMAECTVKGAPQRYQLDKTGIWGEVVRQRRPLIVNDFQAANPLKRGYPEGHVALGNFMSVPVLREGRIVAVAGVGNRDGDYQDGDVMQLSLLMDACWQVVGRLDAEHDVRRSLHEKEVLLKEIHHRVKNNLQLISSLLFLQAEYVIEPLDKAMFEESQKRISAMALVHEELYGSVDLSSVGMGEFVPRLVDRVVASADVPVRVEYQVENVRLPVTRSIPCGLVLNELVMNAVKHAFRSGRNGRLRVALTHQGGQLELIVEDNGPGLSSDFDLESSATLGLTLITSLARQLFGSVTAESLGSGARFTLRFPLEEA